MTPATRGWLPLGVLLLVGLALLATSIGGTRTSSATFTTASQTEVYASVDTTSNWLHLWAQSTDPAGLTGYATRRLSGPPEVPAAEGRDEGLMVDLGGYPDLKADFQLDRVFTLETPASFPDPAITEVTIRAALVADPSGAQPLRKVTLTPLTGTGNQATAIMAVGQKYQLNVGIRSKRNFVVGQTYYPHVVITVSFTGAPAGYYVYDFPMAFTDAGQ